MSEFDLRKHLRKWKNMSSPQSRLIDDANTTREFDTTLRPPKSSADDDVTGVAGESKLDILLDLLSDEETTGPPPAPPGLRNEEGKLDVTKVIQYFERRGSTGAQTTPVASRIMTPRSPLLLGVEMPSRSMSPFVLEAPPQPPQSQGQQDQNDSLELSPIRFVPPLPSLQALAPVQPTDSTATNSLLSESRVPELTREVTNSTHSSTSVPTITSDSVAPVGEQENGPEPEAERNTVSSLAEVETTLETTNMNHTTAPNTQESSSSVPLTPATPQTVLSSQDVTDEALRLANKELDSLKNQYQLLRAAVAQLPGMSDKTLLAPPLEAESNSSSRRSRERRSGGNANPLEPGPSTRIVRVRTPPKRPDPRPNPQAHSEPLLPISSSPTTSAHTRVHRRQSYLATTGSPLRRTTSISPSGSPSQSYSPLNPNSGAERSNLPPSRTGDTSAALTTDFVLAIDKLVWRKTRPKEVVLSQDNVDSLLERLGLWERVVRTRYR